MSRPEFDERELERTGEYVIEGIYSQPVQRVPKLNTPITPRENMLRMMRGQKPYWLPNQIRDNNAIQPKCMADAVARSVGGTDWFGVVWEYEPKSNASMVKPGTRRLSEIEDWKTELVFPDLDAIDWQGYFDEHYKGILPNDRFTYFCIVNGIFERLADLTSFEDTFCYLLEEQEVLHEFFDAMVDWHIDLIRHAKKYFSPDMILWHDDMGSQKSAFFSPELYREMLLPHYKKLTSAIHEMGMFISLHSCGNVGVQIPNFIEAGFDAWEGQEGVNDKYALMQQYGEQLVQLSNFIIPASLSDEEAIALVHRQVETLGATGRYGCRFRDEKPDRDVDLADELYRYSRIKYQEWFGDLD